MPDRVEQPLRPVAAIVATVAHVQSGRGPQTTRYITSAELGGALLKFVVGSVLTDDDRTTLVPLGGGTAGAWIRQREDDRGEDLDDGDATIQIGDGAWRVLPAATLTGNATLTLGTTNAAAGDCITVTRDDATANTVAIVNGGIAGGTILTLPVSVKSFAVCQFDGTNWRERMSGLRL